MKIVLASNNKNKIREIEELLAGKYEIVGLAEVGITEEIEEPFETFKENAFAKADYVYQKTGLLTFSEDSGLVVAALKGAPGVYSARYAGEPKDDEKNTQRLLDEMKDKDDRTAYYQTTICLVGNGAVQYFEGFCEGRIAEEQIGAGGFGYDPVFIPKGYDTTFGVLPSTIKQSISHRAAAVGKLIAYLNSI
jgi:XTP/dITP diphosphohydrolase